MGSLHDPGAALGIVASISNFTMDPFRGYGDNCHPGSDGDLLSSNNLGGSASMGSGSRVHLRRLVPGTSSFSYPLPSVPAMDSPGSIGDVGGSDPYSHDPVSARISFPEKERILSPSGLFQVGYIRIFHPQRPCPWRPGSSDSVTGRLRQ